MGWRGLLAHGSTMDVTAATFDDAFQLFNEVLPRALFASIDLEFTGLRVNNAFKRCGVEPVRVWCVSRCTSDAG